MIVKNSFGGGTSFDSIFRTIDPGYDRVFVISDMQGGDGILVNSSYQTYTKANGKPYIYSVNLCGYESTMFKQKDKLINLFGYSSDIYEQIKVAEVNPAQILTEIRKIII
jgi:hypothetical protein